MNECPGVLKAKECDAGDVECDVLTIFPGDQYEFVIAIDNRITSKDTLDIADFSLRIFEYEKCTDTADKLLRSYTLKEFLNGKLAVPNSGSVDPIFSVLTCSTEEGTGDSNGLSEAGLSKGTKSFIVVNACNRFTLSNKVSKITLELSYVPKTENSRPEFIYRFAFSVDMYNNYYLLSFHF